MPLKPYILHYGVFLTDENFSLSFDKKMSKLNAFTSTYYQYSIHYEHVIEICQGRLSDISALSKAVFLNRWVAELAFG